MIFSQETGGSLDIVESMTVAELDVDEERFRARYDAGRDPASMAIVAVVATADGSDPRELSPLHSAIDTDALDELFAEPSGELRRSGRLTFRYEGYEVTVVGEGAIELASLERSDRG